MKMIDIFGDLNPNFYFQNLYFCEVNSHFPINGGNLYPFASETSPMLYENAGSEIRKNYYVQLANQ